MTDTKVAKRRLKDITFEHDGAHVALVHKEQGGAANGYTTLITKSTNGITDQQVASQIALIEKAKFNSEVRSKLSDALDSKFASRYEWLYLEDFSGDEVVFQADAGMFIVGYSLSSEDEYSFDDVARGFSYELIRVENGQVKLSEDAQSKLSEGEYVLVNKALNNPETNSRVIMALADFTEKKENMETEIQKAVAGHVAENDALRAELDSLKEIVKAAAAEKKVNLLKSREAEVSAVLKEGAVELVKSTESLSDESFAEIVKALNAQKAVIEKSDLMTEMNDPEANTDGPAEVNNTMEIIKAKFPKAQ
jgi:hypothetical protein